MDTTNTSGTNAAPALPVMSPALKEQLNQAGITQQDHLEGLINQGLTEVGDLDGLELKHLVAAGMPPIKAGAAFNRLKPAAPPATPIPSATPVPSFPAPNALPGVVPTTDVLPGINLADSDAFAKSLIVGSERKVDDTDLAAGIYAWLDQQTGIFGIVSWVGKKVKSIFDSVNEPYGPEHYALNDLVEELEAKVAHGPIFKALKVPGNYYTASAKKELVQGVGDFVRALQGFHSQALRWRESVAASSSMNSGQLLQAVFNPGSMGVLAALQSELPDITALQESARVIVKVGNSAWKKAGPAVSRAMANESIEVSKIVDVKANLHVKLGFMNRDQMLTEMGFATKDNLLRYRTQLVRYALSVVRLAEKVNDMGAIAYIGQLIKLGESIPWHEFTGTAMQSDLDNGGRVTNSRRNGNMSAALNSDLPNDGYSPRSGNRPHLG